MHAHAHAYEIIDDPKQAATLLQHPIRQRLMSELATPLSAAGLAKIVALPRQKINYHLRELEKAGLIEMVEEKIRGNAKERIMVSTAAHYLVDPTLFSNEGDDVPDAGDRFSIMNLIGVMARGIRDILTVRKHAAKAQMRVATLSLESQVCFANAKDRHAYIEALANSVAQLNAQYHKTNAKGGRTFTVFLGAWPTITKEEENSNE